MGAQADFFRGAYDLAFQVSPIALTGGIASEIPGGAIPIALLLGSLLGFVQGAITTGGLTLQDFPWRFIPQSGTQVLSQSLGEYPFANRQIAANATIENPLNITYKLINPVNTDGGYITKLPMFTSLRESLNTHNNSGGTYTIIMPSLILKDCVLLDMTDSTSGDKQQQIEWTMNFRKPLISIASGQQAFNGLMGIIENAGMATGSAWSGIATSIGNQASGLIGAL
ncbi:hypothetical protein [Acidithiobacillus sp.]|uniref:hypothetical protein n=1 Tax=Acidithiobacillus sp. TaxID=1872118 RepID=UPI003D02D618